jgi:hypothetical protein
MADGQVKAGIIKSNRSVALFDTKSHVVAMAASPDGQSFVSGHLDGAVYLYSFPSGSVPCGVVLDPACVPCYDFVFVSCFVRNEWESRC